MSCINKLHVSLSLITKRQFVVTDLFSRVPSMVDLDVFCCNDPSGVKLHICLLQEN